MTTNHEMRMEALRLFEENARLRDILLAIDHTLVVHGHIDRETPLHNRITSALARMALHSVAGSSVANDGRVRLVDQNGTEVVGAGPACAGCKKIPTPDCDNPACAFRAGLKSEPTVRCDWCGGTLLCRSPVQDRGNP